MSATVNEEEEGKGNAIGCGTLGGFSGFATDSGQTCSPFRKAEIVVVVVVVIVEVDVELEREVEKSVNKLISDQNQQSCLLCQLTTPPITQHQLQLLYPVAHPDSSA